MKTSVKNYINTFIMRIVNAAFYLILAVSIWGVLIRIFSLSNYNVTDLSHIWTNEAGDFCRLSEFGSQDSQRVYYMPDSIAPDTVIVLRARNCYVNFYVNGELLHEDYRIHSPLYGSSPGSRWHMLSLDASKEPVQLCLEVTACYSDSKGLIDNIYLGKTQEIYRKITSERIWGFVVSAFLYLCGVVIIVLYFFIRRGHTAGKDLLYLGLATFFSAQWLSAESVLWQLFIGHSEVIHLWGYTALTAIPLSYGMLAVHRLKGKLRTFSIGFSFVSAVGLIGAVILQLFGIADFHYSLIITRMLVICIAISLIKYIQGSYGNYSSYVRTALLCFLMCLIVYQFNQIVTTFSKGMKADMLHDLALTDYMTGLYNRTAFNEHVPEYNHIIDSFSPLGIIQFDVNNLKKVNDTLGHEKGDMMIKAVADGLRYAFVHFEKECASYRTGGDEFLTVINAISADEIYHTCIQRLMQYCEDFNKQPDLDFTLTIAHGYVLVKGGKTLEEAIDEADALMYENKRMLKGLR